MRRRFPLLALLFLLSAVLLGPLRPASSQSAELGGYLVRATAVGTRGVVENSASPTAVQGNAAEFSSPYALAELTTGPTGTALAGASYPGPLVSNLEGQGGPPYPGLARAQSPGGEAEARNEEVPGVTAVATAKGNNVAASVTSSAPTPVPVAGAKGQEGSTNGKVDGTTARGDSTVEVTGFTLGEVLRIESVRSKASATATPDKGTAEASTVVTGVTVAGQPAVIDEKGIRFTGPPPAPAPAPVTVPAPVSTLPSLLPGGGDAPVPVPGVGEAPAPVPGGDEVLRQAGISLRVAGPVERKGPGAAEATAGGLVIQVEDLQRLGGPPTGAYTFVIGQASVSVEASKGFGFESLPPPPPLPSLGEPLPAVDPLPVFEPLPSTLSSPGDVTSTPSPTPTPTPGAVTLPTEPADGGVPIGPAAVGSAGLVALAASAGLRKVFYETFRPEQLPEEP